MVFVDFVVGVTFQLHHPFPVCLSTGDDAGKERPSCGIAFYSFSVGNSVAFMPQPSSCLFLLQLRPHAPPIGDLAHFQLPLGFSFCSNYPKLCPFPPASTLNCRLLRSPICTCLCFWKLRVCCGLGVLLMIYSEIERLYECSLGYMLGRTLWRSKDGYPSHTEQRKL